MKLYDILPITCVVLSGLLSEPSVWADTTTGNVSLSLPAWDIRRVQILNILKDTENPVRISWTDNPHILKIQDDVRDFWYGCLSVNPDGIYSIDLLWWNRREAKKFLNDPEVPACIPSVTDPNE
jgi:hypothetical protein